MNNNEIAQIINIPTSTLKRFMSLPGKKLLKDPEYIAILKDLDRELLEATLADARNAYEKGLPAFSEQLAARYGLDSTPMSAYTLGNWVVGALQYPENTDQILKMHDRVPGEAISGGLTDLLHMLDNLPAGAQEWQRALAVLSLPLMNS
jgi:hypothetical protein